MDRWLEKAARECHRFNDRRITGLKVTELQADEIRTIVGGKKQPIWIFVSIDVWSRLWPSTIVGRRSYRNTLGLFRDLSFRMVHRGFSLIATDGFKFYRQVVWRIFGVACFYGQVVKNRRKDRIVKVEHKTRFGSAWRWEQAWKNSEDSRKLNTSYIERLNLTIRQGSAYLNRRTLSHARRLQQLEDHLELLRCHYNFVRRHRVLKFGREVRTPAMSGGSGQKSDDVPRHLHRPSPISCAWYGPSVSSYWRRTRPVGKTRWVPRPLNNTGLRKHRYMLLCLRSAQGLRVRVIQHAC